MPASRVQLKNICVRVALAVGAATLPACGNTVVISGRVQTGDAGRGIDRAASDANVSPAGGVRFDEGFNSARPSLVAAPGKNIKPLSIASDESGKILIAGSISSSSGADFVFPLRDSSQRRDVFIARMMADGSIDRSFGADRSGMVTIKVRNNEQDVDSRAYQVLALADGGAVVVAGYGTSLPPSGPGNFAGLAVARLAVDGQPAAGFGVNGVALVPCSSGGAFPAGIALSGEKLLVGGTCNNPGSSSPRMILRRLSLASGALDPVTEFPANDRFILPAAPDVSSVAAYSMVVLRSGEILLGGSARKGTATRELAAIQSFEPNGTPGGFSYVGAEGSDDAFVMGLREGAGLLAMVSARCQVGGDGRACLTSGGGEGRDVVTILRFPDHRGSATHCAINGVDASDFVPFAMQVSGNKIFVGGTRKRERAGFTLTHFEVDPSKSRCEDSLKWTGSSGSGGFFAMDPVGRYEFVRAMVMDGSGGKVIVAGPSYSNGDSAAMTGRYLVK